MDKRLDANLSSLYDPDANEENESKAINSLIKFGLLRLVNGSRLNGRSISHCADTVFISQYKKGRSQEMQIDCGKYF